MIGKFHNDFIAHMHGLHALTVSFKKVHIYQTVRLAIYLKITIVEIQGEAYPDHPTTNICNCTYPRTTKTSGASTVMMVSAGGSTTTGPATESGYSQPTTTTVLKGML